MTIQPSHNTLFALQLHIRCRTTLEVHTFAVKFSWALSEIQKHNKTKTTIFYNIIVLILLKEL